MKPALLLSLLLAACASPTAVIDQRSFLCGPGQDIEVRAGIIDPAATREAAGPIMYLLEIANNSHNDVTVTYIKLEPDGETIPGLHGLTRQVEQLIPAGEDHLFELPASDVWVRSSDFFQGLEQRRLRFSAIVRLSNGDAYRCQFETRWK